MYFLYTVPICNKIVTDILQHYAGIILDAFSIPLILYSKLHWHNWLKPSYHHCLKTILKGYFITFFIYTTALAIIIAIIIQPS